MATQLKLRRGTTAQHSTFTGAEAEVTVDTSKKSIVVHDGTTPGGNTMAPESNPKFLGDVHVNYQIADGNYYGMNVWGRDYPTYNVRATGAYNTGGGVEFFKSRGSHTVPTVVLANDNLGSVVFKGYDGTAFRTAGSITVQVEGAPGANSMPGRMDFRTTPSGSTTPVSRLGITQNGIIEVFGPVNQSIVAVPALNIDCSLGNYFTKTISASSTFSVSNVPSGRVYSFMLEVTHTSGTISWFANVVWPNNQAPSLTTGRTHLFMFITDDGGAKWRGSSLANYTS